MKRPVSPLDGGGPGVPNESWTISLLECEASYFVSLLCVLRQPGGGNTSAFSSTPEKAVVEVSILLNGEGAGLCERCFDS